MAEGARRLARAGVLALALLAVALPGAAAERWGWLGVRIRDLSEQEMNEISTRHGIREGFGAMIVEVIKETPAETSGLQAGDLVVAFRDRPVVDTRSLIRLIGGSAVGETVPLTILRRDEGRRRFSVRLAAMPDPVAADRIAGEIGFFVREPEGQPELGGARPSTLPTVSGVLPGSRAAGAGMRVGDVLVEVDGKVVLTFQALREALLAWAPDRPLPLVVRRGGERVPVVVPEPRKP
jgi:serine protease Do